MGGGGQYELVANKWMDVTVPAAIERMGEFSQSHDGGGAALTIKNPLNGGAQFPGNSIPKARLNLDGVKVLNFYPQPNALRKDPSFNYQSHFSNISLRREHL